MSCPYHDLPPSSYWKAAIALKSDSPIDPHLDSKLKLTRETRVASAGSCFAQHISRALQERGYNYFVTEPPPSGVSSEAATQYGYGMFSARYGNVYTTLQLLQLVLRAQGSFVPADQFWSNDQRKWFDLLRPRIVPGGFSSRTEAEHDAGQHLAAVRRLLKEAEVFIFTLGLTEVWVSSLDGTAYPTCPGCGSAGEFDSSRYVFRNLSVAETSAALSMAIDLITAINPSIQFVLTVSPVPLLATMEPRHILQATTYSKSVLRVVAEEMIRKYANVHYFGSYEIITATRKSHVYFDHDGRSITSEGVEQAMKIFFNRFGVTGDAGYDAMTLERKREKAPVANKVICDEEEFFEGVARLHRR